MANELAAIATMPSGATITVVMICAPQMAACSNPIGRAMRTALRNVSFRGTRSPRSPDSFSRGDRRQRYHIIPPPVASSASTVPNAAPSTPRPAPGTTKLKSRISICRVGKIRKKLNTTSSRHISTFNRLGTRMFPLHRNIPPARKFSCRAGKKSENIRK